MRTGRKRVLTALAVVGALSAAFACNVFVTIEQCSSDADCSGGATCDPVGGFCVRAVPADGPIEAGDEKGDADAGVDVDAARPRCNPLDPFVTQKPVLGLEDVPIISARLAPDEKTVFFTKLNACAGEECFDIFVAGRGDAGVPFAKGAAILPIVNCSQASEYFPSLSANGLRIFFESSRRLAPDPDGGGCGIDVARIWSAKREKTDDLFDPPTVETPFRDPTAVDTAPYLHPSGRSLYFVSTGRPGPGDQDIHVARFDSKGFVTSITVVDKVSTTEAENAPVISLDETALYFARDPAGGAERRIWMGHRAGTEGPFDDVHAVNELNTHADQLPGWISDDNCRLYFTTNSENVPDGGLFDGYRLWVAERAPKP